MDRCAVFVDAGYLLSEGGKAFCGVRKRSLVSCDYRSIVEEIERFCRELHGLPALRMYWYDGASEGIPTGDHVLVAGLPRVKLRLGRLSGGKQKGVDSLIVHDLITLSHERAVASMYLLGGDEDLREGVAAAQRVGVQVCLLGVDTGQPNQALTLIAEADEHVMLPDATFRSLFSVAAAASVPEGLEGPDATRSDESRVEAGGVADDGVMETAAPDEELTVAARVAARDFATTWAAGVGLPDLAEVLLLKPRIPPELDVQLLLAAEHRLGRSLRGDQPLRHALRDTFWETITSAAKEEATQQ